MAIQIGDEPERRTPAEKIAPWLRRVIIGGGLVWIMFSMENYYEDARSHTIKVVYPLLLSRESITSLQPGYDPHKAVWKPLQTGFPVRDGTILFVKTGGSIYAVKLLHQKVSPEGADYEYLKVGSPDPVVKGTAETYPDGIALPGRRIGWSGKHDGTGYLYLDDAFIRNQPPSFTIGVPFQTGDLEQFRQAIPPNVHFESVPWKIIEPSPDEIGL
jgi:hypothetical protein